MTSKIRFAKPPTTSLAGIALTICLLGCQPEETHEPSEPAATPTASNNEEVQGRGEGKDQWWDALPRAAGSDFQQITQSLPWFEVYEIRPDIFALYEPGQFEEVISYLIVGSERERTLP